MTKNENNAGNATILSKKITRIFLVFFVFFMSVYNVFALDDAKIVERVDAAFQRQSEEQLAQILIENKGSDNYATIEAYILKKIHESLVFDRLEYAHLVSLALSANTMDNFSALDLYTRISATLDIYDDIEAVEELIRLAKIEKEQKAAKEIRTEFEKDLQQVVTPEGQNVYFTNLSEARYTSIDWRVSFGFMEFSILSTSLRTSVKYGVGVSGNIFYYGDSLAFGAEASIASYMLTFVSAENFVTDFKIVPSISFFDVSRNLFFRFGVKGIFTDPTQNGTSVANFISPVIGAEWKNITIGSTKTNVSVDYLFGDFVDPKIKVALEAGIKTEIIISRQENFAVGFLFGFFDTLMITDTGIENHAKLTMSIGVGNYE